MNTTPTSTPTPTPATLTAAGSHTEARDAAGEWIAANDGTASDPVPTTADAAVHEAAQRWAGYLAAWWLEEQAAAEEHGTEPSGEYRIVWTAEDGEAIATLEVHAPDEDGEVWFCLEHGGRTVHHGWVPEAALLAAAA